MENNINWYICIVTLSSWKITSDGGSLMRALWMDFPNDKRVANLSDEFLFGKSILVAPVISPVKERLIYLPKGSSWVDFWTGEKIPGGNTFSRKVPIDIIPLYVKVGSIIPMGPSVQYSTEKTWTYKPTSQDYVDGDHNYPAYDNEMLESENPVAATDSRLTGYRQEKRVNFNGALTLTYDIPGVKGLNAKAFYSYDYYTTNNTEYKRTYNLYNRNADGTMDSFIRNSDSYLRRNTDPNYGTVMQLSLNYANKFGNHNVSGMVLFEEQYNNWDNFYAQRVMLMDGQYLIYGEDEDQVGSMTGAGDKTRQAIVGRVNYDYKGRYMYGSR